ncbi:Rho GTPase activation protein (RhoGAP) with PH domain-containing protein [Rhynchospora pubera]|uniref:Rho GTPase activation protein (RhoGAP) with PH domain-containing protein n=1 Tax=Rhynchospora pubera TaxID=906938 RepID=A0AAV8FXJ0_9POAL|nr:Rho GTPase activation protein (RhoGAP) with PH domain-containing protein [Rhynchospora pubera]
MATSQNGENGAQNMTCRCGEGDPNVWINRTSDNSDKISFDCPNCQIIKSGHLLVSSKGLAWPSWKRRWFVLTRTSLIFFRHDPNAPPIKGSEPNATLGGIDLNSSASVVVKADKKLLTVVFGDGRDGRTFTLKADTSEDLNEWKNALENAMAQAPSTSHSLGQNGIFRTDSANLPVEFPPEQKEKVSEKSLIQAPVMFALEDSEGNPSFLEKALCFIEDYGIKVEGILRQSADVEEVKRRVQDYEQGKDEFSPDEDAHVIGDCIKLVLREMPEFPVPAECCTALVDAYRTKISDRIDAIRDTIYETFPEPNRLLLQRILRMMLEVAAHKVENRMSLQALAACMAPLLLRPLVGGLLAGPRVDGDFANSANGQGDSFQLLQAAAAANSAQNIVIILLEEFDHIFDEDGYSSEVYTESEGDESHEASTDNEICDKRGDSLGDDGYEDEDEDEDEHEDEDDNEDEDEGTEHDNPGYDHDDNHHEHEVQVGDSTTRSYEATKSESNSEAESNLSHDRDIENNNSQAIPDGTIAKDVSQGWSKQHLVPVEEPNESQIQQSTASSGSHVSRTIELSDRTSEMEHSGKRASMWGRTSARKNLSMESMETNSDDEDRILVQKLESTKIQLQTKLSKEKKENATLLASLERRRDALQEQRLQLEKDVQKLREQLKQEKQLRTLLEGGFSQHGQSSSISTESDSKIWADLEAVAVEEEEISNLKQKVLELRSEYHRKLEKSYASLRDFCNDKLNKSTDLKNCTTLEDERDKIFADFIDKHGPPSPCLPEMQRTESTSQNNNSSANDDQVKNRPATKSTKVSPENEKKHLPPKSTKSGQSSTNSSFGEDSSATFCMLPERQGVAQKATSLRSLSQGDNVKKETPFALDSVPKCWSQKQPEETSLDGLSGATSSKKSSYSSSSDAGSLSPAAKAKLTKRLQFLKERLVQRAGENSVTQPTALPPPPTNSQ